MKNLFQSILVLLSMTIYTYSETISFTDCIDTHITGNIDGDEDQAYPSRYVCNITETATYNFQSSYAGGIHAPEARLYAEYNVTNDQYSTLLAYDAADPEIYYDIFNFSVKLNAGQTYYLRVNSTDFDDGYPANGDFGLHITQSDGDSKKPDFNGDGIADILWRKGSINTIWYMNVDGTHLAKQINSKSSTYEVASIADFNGDGIDDILWRKGSTNYIWYMNANGTREYKLINPKSSAYKVAGVADFNGDGIADILWRKGSTNYIWYMHTDGSRNYKLINPKHASYEVAGIADFNGNGAVDILWRKKHGSKAYIWYMGTDGSRDSIELGDNSASYDIVSVKDFNNDGIADIMWRSGSKSSIWYMEAYSGHKNGYKKLSTMPASFKVQK